MGQPHHDVSHVTSVDYSLVTDAELLDEAVSLPAQRGHVAPEK